MLKYVSKFTLDVLPSVVATIIGAYIVNHYIATRPAAYAPVAAVSTAAQKGDATSGAGTDAKAGEASPDIANIPEPGVRAKGISERAIERSVVEKSAEKPAEKPAETVSLPVDPHRHLSAPHEKTVVKETAKEAAKETSKETVKAATVLPAAPVVAPVVVAPNPAPPVEAAIAPEEHRDANDLARAAIERLRASDAPRAQEPARLPDAPRMASAPPVRPLPPPIVVATPAVEMPDSVGPASMKPPYAAAMQIDDPRRPIPPADIPVPRPLDLRAEATGVVARNHTTVAEDVLSAAKSVFHAVLPQSPKASD